jgi:hypothetical protein
MDERFVVPDFDLTDDMYVAGECAECWRESRFLNADMLCPKCAAQHCVNSDVGDSTAPKILIHPEADIPAPDFSTPAPRGLR